MGEDIVGLMSTGTVIRMFFLLSPAPSLNTTTLYGEQWPAAAGLMYMEWEQ